jgi:hypothetical protein
VEEMTLLREIQAAATESKVDISTVLRKAKILAVRLHNPEFESWVDHELNGYGQLSGPDDYCRLPPYRVVPVEVHGHLANRAGLHWYDAPIMPDALPERFRVWGEECYLPQPIAAIVSLAASENNLQVQWPQELAITFGAHGYNRCQCLGAWQLVSPHALVGIVDTVRNRILDFALKIEAENPEAGEALPDAQPVPSDKVRTILQTTIFQNTFNAPVGNVAQNSQGFSQT